MFQLHRLVVPTAVLFTALTCVLGSARAQTAAPAASAPAAVPAAAPGSAPASRPAGKPEPVLIDRIVAVVNSDVITQLELEQREREVVKVLQRQGTPLPPKEVLDHQVLERLIDERAQLQEAADDGIKVDDVMVDRAVERLADQNKMSLPDFRKRVEAEGTTFAAFRQEVRQEIMLARLREREVDSAVQVSEGEVDNYIAAQNGGPNGVEYDIAQILVRVPDQASADQIAKAQAKADGLYQQLQGGADFGKTAVSYSDAPEALTGGDMGWRTQDRYPQVFLDAVANLAPGQISKPVKSPNGFHILKLVGKRSGSTGGIAAPVVQTHVRHILLRVNEVMSAEQARQRLLEIKQRILSGKATFEEMAKAYSVDGSASRGGDLGDVLPGDTVPEFERAMNALKPGEISDPVQTPFGMHLIQVVDRKTESVNQDRLRLMARQILRERKSEEAFADWARSVRDRAYVENHLDDK